MAFFLLKYLFRFSGLLFLRLVTVHANSQDLYHGRWIDSVGNRAYADALKENPINLYIF